MSGWILFNGDEEKISDKVLVENFAKETLENRLSILSDLLCDNFEIYYRDSGNVCVYDKMCEEFITEGGFEGNNIQVFVSNVVENLSLVV